MVVCWVGKSKPSTIYERDKNIETIPIVTATETWTCMDHLADSPVFYNSYGYQHLRIRKSDFKKRNDVAKISF